MEMHTQLSSKAAHASTGSSEWKNACQEIANGIVELVSSKQHDYGTSNITDFGMMGILVRLNDKVSRLKNLYKTGNNPSNETIEDTWRDVVGYGIIALMVINKTFELPHGEEKYK